MKAHEDVPAGSVNTPVDPDGATIGPKDLSAEPVGIGYVVALPLASNPASTEAGPVTCGPHWMREAPNSRPAVAISQGRIRFID